jgi:uncharacterized membrane protein
MVIDTPEKSFNPAEIGALAHLYRAEIYRSTVWRSRLDNTTNWAVVTTGIALSASFANAEASPLPLVIVGLLVIVFLVFEGRRYRYFHMYRARARVMENSLYCTMLEGRGTPIKDWCQLLSHGYRYVETHISVERSVGRRLRRNYAWILAIQAIAYYGKLVIHPHALGSIDELLSRAAIGPIPGSVTILAGILFHSAWIIFAAVTLRMDKKIWKKNRTAAAAMEDSPTVPFHSLRVPAKRAVIFLRPMCR